MSSYEEDLSHDITDLRTCCNTGYHQHHFSTCPRMVALDESFKRDSVRHLDSLVNHSAEALHDRTLLTYSY